MRLLPEGIGETGPNLQWAIECQLQLIEEVACAPQASGTGGPGREEAMEPIRRALKRRDKEATSAALVDWVRAEVREWWQAFPERRLLSDLYQRAALRGEGRKSHDGPSGLPTHREGLLVAKALLADIAAADRFDFAWESEAVSTVLADQWLSLSGKRRPAALQDYIERSRFSRAYFDALRRIVEMLHSRGEFIPGPLARWRDEAAGGLRRRPAKNPVAFHRPITSAQRVRDAQIQLVIELLRRVGIKPRGTRVSGCRVVAEALERIAVADRSKVALSEETATRIWEARVWKEPFEPVLRKHSKAIADRTGPFRTH